MKKKEKRRATTFLKKKYLQKKKIVGHLNFEHSSKNYNSIIFIFVECVKMCACTTACILLA